MLKNPIRLGNFQNGLTSLGKLEQNKWVTMDNVDIHTEVGIATCNLDLSVESSTPNEPCYSAIVPDGTVYFASKSTGKLWRRTVVGTYTLIHTNVNGAHRGIRYFNGNLWFWTATRLGYFDLSVTYNDSFATGTNFRQGIEANNSLLIANGRFTARLDSGNVFSANEFVVPAMFEQTILQNIGDDVLIGTIVSTEVAYCKFFLWNTVSSSWSYEDEVFEIGANTFVQIDNLYIAQCGTEGRFYYWTGSRMAYFRKIRGITTSLNWQNYTNLGNRPLYLNGSKVYSFHKEDNALPAAVVAEYTLPVIGASVIVQAQTLLISTSTAVYTQDTNYATAVIESPEVQTQISDIRVKYDAYPEGIGIETSINGASYVTQTPVVDDLRREVYFNGGVVDGYTTQVRITLTPSGSNVPKIKEITLQ